MGKLINYLYYHLNLFYSKYGLWSTKTNSGQQSVLLMSFAITIWLLFFVTIIRYEYFHIYSFPIRNWLWVGIILLIYFTLYYRFVRNSKQGLFIENYKIENKTKNKIGYIISFLFYILAPIFYFTYIRMKRH